MITDAIKDIPNRRHYGILLETANANRWAYEVFEEEEPWKQRMIDLAGRLESFRAIQADPFAVKIDITLLPLK